MNLDIKSIQTASALMAQLPPPLASPLLAGLILFIVPNIPTRESRERKAYITHIVRAFIYSIALYIDQHHPNMGIAIDGDMLGTKQELQQI